MLSKKVTYVLTTIAALIILILSLIPKPPNIAVGVRFGDKLAHFIAYFILSLFVAISKDKAYDTLR